MFNEILATCKQLNRLLNAKDPYHSDLVSTLLAKIESHVASDNPQGVDKDVIIEALNKND